MKTDTKRHRNSQSRLTLDAWWPRVLASLSIFYFATSLSIGQEFQAPIDVAFVAKLDATEQRYVLLIPKDADLKVHRTLLIVLHGHGSDRWQFIQETRGECRAARDVALQHQAIVVSPDYRARTSWMGPAAEADMSQILDDLHERYSIRRVIISGGSMGGTSALAYAAMHPEKVHGVVSLNGTANIFEYEGFQEAIAESYGGSRTDKSEVYRERSAELHLEKLTMPIATTTGGQDTLVPPQSTLRMMAALEKKQRTTLSLHRPDGGHETNYEDSVKAFQFVFDQQERN